MNEHSIKRIIKSQSQNTSSYISIQEMIDLFMEVAQKHIDMYDSQSFENKMWMIYRWMIKMNDDVNLSSELEIRTKVPSADRLSAFRYFEAVNERGEIIASAMSQWVLVDTKRRRIALIPKSYRGVFYDEFDTEEIQKIEKIFADEREEIFSTSSHEVDKNNHINNAVYVDYILKFMDKIKPGFTDQYAIEELNIIYAKEILHPSEIIIAMNESGEMKYDYTIYNRDKSQAHCFVQAKYAQILD